MYQKHLIRFQLDNIPHGIEYIDGITRTDRLISVQEELKSIDEILARYFTVHVIGIDYEERGKEGWMEHARDFMQQINGGIFVKSHLEELADSPKLPTSRKFMKAIIETGFSGNLISSAAFSEGGKFIPASKFWLISDTFGKEVAGALCLDLKLPVHRVSPLFDEVNIPYESGTLPNGKKGPAHIDTFYGVVDAAKIIYSRLSIIPLELLDSALKTQQDPSVKKHYSNLDLFYAMCFMHGYELRHFGFFGANETGVNFITGDGIIVTNGINPEEKVYLAKKGVEAIEVALTHNSGNAGVRCYYAEVLVPKYPVAQGRLVLPGKF